MKTMKFIGFLVFVLALIQINGLSAQTNFASESEMIKGANTMFDQKKFEQAMPLYSQLVSLYPKEADYNMKYGVCLIHADPDKSASLKYLKYAASKSESDAIAHYYYAHGLHINYDFSRAIKSYEKYKSLAGKKIPEEFMVDRQIEMCNNGKTLLKNIFDLNVIEKKEISRTEFFRIYNLGEIGGKIIVKPDEFKTKNDKKSTETDLIHLPNDANVIYVSGYNDDKTKGKDIYRIRKSGDVWGLPENIGDVVNTAFDEDYPFMHPDGTLYFASKGHNSMGGFDLFKSAYNESTGTWSAPQNLNFPVNSVFDDILFITDYKKQLAYFASGRASTDGMLNVYRVQIATKPFDNAFLAGKFISEGNNEISSAKITIYDVESNSKVGTYFTDKSTGEYNISLPKGGKTYKFVVETDENSPAHTGKVDVPVQEGMLSLKQEIRLVGSGNEQKLVIKNLFNETSEVDEEMMISVLQSSSDLEVNSSESEVLSQIPVEEEGKSTSTSAASGTIQENHATLIAEMEMLKLEIKQNVTTLQDQVAFGFKYSLEKAQAADQMYDQVEVARQSMVNESDPIKKETLTKNLLDLKNKLNPIASDAIVSFDFTKSLANEYAEKISDIERIGNDLAKIKASPSKNEEEMKSDIKIYGLGVNDLKSMRSAFDIAPQRYAELLSKTDEKLKREKTFYDETRRDMEALQLELKKIEGEIEKATNKKTKEQLEAEKGSKEIDFQDLEYEFSSVSKKYSLLRMEAKNLESDAKQINVFINKIKTNSRPVVQLSNEDQAELNKIIDFLKEQRLLEDVIGEEMETFMSAGVKKEDLSKAQKYSAGDNSGNAVQYDEMYAVNLASIEMISDEEERFIESAALYKNWANTIAEDIEIKKNDLAYTKDKAGKQVLEERIRILEEKEKEYKQISVEYQAKALAQSEVAVAESATQVENTSNKTEAKIVDKPADEGKGGTSTSVKSADGDTKTLGVNSLLAVGFVAADAPSGTLNEVNSSYASAKKEIEDEEGIAAEISLAAFELSWAKSIDKLIKQKEVELAATANEADWKKIQETIDQYKKEKEVHIAKASSEFTALQIDEHMGEGTSDKEGNKYYIPFDPQNPDFESYNEEYAKLVLAVENHQILTPDQKNKELSLIHNFWSITIQDEILWQEKEKTKLKSQTELLEIENKILELNVDKKEHISLSNEFYQKYKSSQLYVADVSEKSESTPSSGSEITKEEAKTFGEYAQVYAKYQDERTDQINKMEMDKAEVGSKGEKQQISLSVALLKKQIEDEALAEEELNSKPTATLISEEADKNLKEKGGSWKEKSEEYVFSKKDFTADIPENAEALENYQDAREAYNEVQYLESRKTGLLSSSVVNKNAETEVILLQEQIELKKIEAYKALAMANKLQFESNKREIEQLLVSNPDLEKTNPKLFRDIKAADIIYSEAEKYRENAEGFKSNVLKFEIYDQAQFMSEYVLTEQDAIIVALKGETYKGELAFLAVSSNESVVTDNQIENFKIGRSEMEAIIENPIFIEYEKDRKALAEIRKERIEIEAQVVNEEAALKALMDERNMMVQSAEGQKKGKKKKLMKEAEVIEAEMAVQQKTLDSVSLAMVQLKEKENNINRNSARLLKSASVEDRYKMVMLAELRMREAVVENYISETEVSVSEPVADLSVNDEVAEKTESGFASEVVALPVSTTRLNNDEFRTLGTEIPKELEGDLFITAATANVSPYNERKPIPVDVEIPKGLVFKVQIGAYRNPIPQDLFKGFAPLMGEKLDNGITRYTAGLFRDFNNANNAKNEIRKMGYQDAFVVAFVDGKRIAFMELRNIENLNVSIPRTAPDNTYNGVPPEVLTTPSIIDDEGEISSAIAEQSTNTMEIKGIFFTVQVGVYTNTLLPQKLKPLRELNSELMLDGNVRYSVGQFKTVDEARQRRENILEEVGDAFITAYENGKRIPVGEATSKLNQGVR